MTKREALEQSCRVILGDKHFESLGEKGLVRIAETAALNLFVYGCKYNKKRKEAQKIIKYQLTFLWELGNFDFKED